MEKIHYRGIKIISGQYNILHANIYNFFIMSALFKNREHAIIHEIHIKYTLNYFYIKSKSKKQRISLIQYTAQHNHAKVVYKN